MIDKEKLLKELQCLKEGCCHSIKTCKYRIDGVYQTQTECIASVIKNFPEEPEIDFDALFEECGKETMAKSFVNFLKSKHLSAPQVDMDALRNEIYSEIVNSQQKTKACPECGCKEYLNENDLGDGYRVCKMCKQEWWAHIVYSEKPRELPVKTIYTLKKEYQDVFKDFGFLHSTFDTHSYEPPPENIKKYYDRTDEVDYSAIPNGSVVEVRIKGVGNHFCKFHSINDADGSINLHCVGESDCTFKLNKDDFIRVVEWAKEV